MLDLRALAGIFLRTPLHPQWLLGRRRVPAGLERTTGRVLDIGSADRWVEKHLHPEASYIALDFPATGAQLYGARPHVYADGARLPFPDETFDGILCLEVIEHARDPQGVVSEIARALGARGTAWISVPFLYPVHDAPFDFQRFTEFGLRRELEAQGLQIISLERSLSSVATAGLLACLALAGPVKDARGFGRWLRLPFAALAILCINVSAYVLSWFWPDWKAMGAGYEMIVRKP